MKVTVYDVAAAAGVSPMTVSRVTNDSPRVSTATRERVLQVMDQLGYIPNRLARGLVGHRTGVLALVVSDLTNPYFTRLSAAVEGAARQFGMTVIIGNSSEQAEIEADYVRKLLSLQVDGLIITPAGDASADILSTLAQRDIPYVLVDRKVAGVDADVVRVNSRSAARRLVQHLVDSGHTRIGAVVGPASMSSHEERLQGWRDVLRPSARAEKTLLVRCQPTRAAAAEAAHRLLTAKDRPAALLVGNNVQAFGVLDAAESLGLRVPNDLALVAFDDVEVGPRAPYFTSADGPVEVLGQSALRLLMERLESPDLPLRDEVHECAVTLRASCHADHVMDLQH